MSFQSDSSELLPDLDNSDTALSTLRMKYLEFLFMSVVKTELNDVERKSLHFLTNSKSMSINLLIFFCLLEINRIKTFRNQIIVT